MTARDRMVLVVVLAAAMLGGFWFMVLKPKRGDAAKLSEQISQAQQQLTEARASAAGAEQAKARYDDDYATVARLGKAVPVDADMPSLLYQIEHAARASHIDFRSIDLVASGAVAPPAAAPPAAAIAAAGVADSNKAASKGADSAAATTPAPATQAAAAGLPPGAAVGPAGFPLMPFTFEFDGSFFDMERFLRSIGAFTTARGHTIRVHGRLLTIDGIALTAGRTGFPRVHASVTANAFLVPADEGLTGGATASAPATTAAAATTPPGANGATTAAVVAVTGGTK